MTEYDRQRDRWYHVKNKITAIWGNITDEELERTRGNISAISHLIIRRYGESKKDVASRLVDVMHSVDNNEDDVDEEEKIEHSRLQ